MGNFTFFNRILGLNKRNLINELKNDNKFKIFAEDKNLVANFNSILSELDPVLLPSTITGDMTDSQGFKDLSKYSININDFVGNYLADNFIGDLLGFKKTDTSSKYLNPIKKNCTLLNELLKNAMQSKFSFSSLNDSCFDQNGNIIKYGQIKNINELISEIINIDYDGEKEELDYEYLENILFQSIIPITELASKFNYINKIPDGDYDVDIDKLSQFSRLDISRIINYCNENLGSKNFKLKDFTNILSEVIVDWIFNSQGKEFLTNHNVNPKFLDLLDEFQDQLKPLLVNALKASPTKLLNFLTFLTNGNDDLITPLLKELLIPGLASPEFIDENAQLINDIITSLGWGPSVAMFLTNGTQRIKDLLLACGNYSEIKDLATQIILEEHSKEDKDNLIRKIKEVNDGGIIDDVQWNILYFLINHFM